MDGASREDVSALSASIHGGKEEGKEPQQQEQDLLSMGRNFPRDKGDKARLCEKVEKKSIQRFAFQSGAALWVHRALREIFFYR